MTSAIVVSTGITITSRMKVSRSASRKSDSWTMFWKLASVKSPDAVWKAIRSALTAGQARKSSRKMAAGATSRYGSSGLSPARKPPLVERRRTPGGAAALT
jgi:hypothetical protein